MKTPREHWNDLILARSLAVETIEARDAEWRRLVKEAKATSTGLADVLKETQAMNIDMRAERDRLKVELAEARRLLAIWHDRYGNGGAVGADNPGRGGMIADTTMVFLAATPAEQAQPTGRDLDICARPKCKSPRHYNIHDPERGGHVFVEAAEQAQPSTEAEKRCVRPDCGRLESCHDVPFAAANHDFDAAEQAQGEAAPTCPGWCYHHPCGERCSKAPHVGNCDCLTHGKPAPDLIELRDVRSALAKTVCRIDGRVDGLAKRVDALAADVAPLVEVWNAQRAAIADSLVLPAPPPPEAAGPGHVFKCESGYAGKDCSSCNHKCECGVLYRNHAVPPIPEGTR